MMAGTSPTGTKQRASSLTSKAARPSKSAAQRKSAAASPAADSAPRPERRDATRNRRLILEAAQRLARKRSLRNIAMDDIAAEAGVGKGTLYRRFHDKTSLIYAMISEPLYELERQALRGFGLPQTASAAQRLATMLELLAELTVTNAAALAEAKAHSRRTGGRFVHPQRDWERYEVARLLQEAGHTSHAADTMQTAELVLTLFDPELAMWQRERGVPDQQIKRSLTEFACNAIGITTQRPR